MKKFTLLLGMILASIIIFAQTPEAFKYQAVARDAGGIVMNSQDISIEISIMESGSAIYVEEHSLATNQFGLFNLNIGEGISNLGDFLTIDWGNGTVNNIDSLTYLAVDTFNIIVTDGNNCTTDTTVIITEPDAVSINETITDIKCFGQNNGTISLSVNNAINPYSVLWSNNETTDSIGNLTEGEYSVIITDNNNCTAFDTIQVNQPNNISFNESVTNITCSGYNNGSVNLQVSGATSPYQFNWSNLANTESINNLIAGQYFVEIIDYNNCNYKDTFIVSEPDSFIFNTNVY